MNNYIEQQLDKVLQLSKEKKQVINRIKAIKTKKIGIYILTITEEEQKCRIEKARTLYDTKINVIYIKMNKELKKAGLEEVENPYKIKKGENNDN